MYRVTSLALVAAVALTACQTTTATSTASTATAPSAALVSTAGATQLGAALNAARASNGLGAVVPSAQLMAAAQVQANYMARTGQLTHSGPGGNSVGDRVSAQGCARGWVGENVAMGQSSDAQTMNLWMDSSGHRRNALNRSAQYYGTAQNGSYRVLVLSSTC